MSAERVGIIYTGRLGDIVGTLPKSYWLHKMGHRVVHYVNRAFAPFLQAVKYVEPRIVDGDVPTSYAQARTLAAVECAKVFDRQVYPNLIHDYRSSGQTWLDYYYRDMDGQAEARRVGEHLFDADIKVKPLPPRTLVVSMNGVSSPLKVDWEWVKHIINRLREVGLIQKVAYTCAQHESCPIEVDILDHSPTWELPYLLKTARLAFMRNSGPSWMAYSVQLPTLHVLDSCFPTTDSAGLTREGQFLKHATWMVPLEHACSRTQFELAIGSVASFERARCE
jgi:hypothetical protein